MKGNCVYQVDHSSTAQQQGSGCGMMLATLFVSVLRAGIKTESEDCWGVDYERAMVGVGNGIVSIIYSCSSSMDQDRPC